MAWSKSVAVTANANVAAAVITFFVDGQGNLNCTVTVPISGDPLASQVQQTFLCSTVWSAGTISSAETLLVQLINQAMVNAGFTGS